jgi:hypothetical protein
MAVEAKDLGAPSAGRAAAVGALFHPRRVGSLLAFLIVWSAGLFFTKECLEPLFPAQWQWHGAIAAQFILTIAQSNLRVNHWREGIGPYGALFGVDALLNTAGFLIVLGTIGDATEFTPFAVGALASGEGLGLLILSAVIGALLALIPEQFLRDAWKGWAKP